MFGLSRWRHRHLLAAWVAYWAALVAITLGGAIRAVLALTLPANGHGSFSASFGDKRMVLTVVDGAATVWRGTALLSTIAVWVALPPLLLWGGWMLSRPRLSRATAEGRALGTMPRDASGSLGPGAAPFAGTPREDVLPVRDERP
jgi:ABC-type amino acid transport system permease subunit